MNNDKFFFHVLKGENVLFIKAFKDSPPSYFRYSITLNHDNQIPILLDIKGDFLSYEIISENEHNCVIL